MKTGNQHPNSERAAASGQDAIVHEASLEPAKRAKPSALFRLLGDVSGAFADLGTFLPLVIGVLAVKHFSPTSVLIGFGCFALATAMIYRRPVPVQPMKAIAAVVIATGLSAETVAAAGIMLGVVLLVLALTGAIERLSRAIPQSVLAGVSLGIGIHLALVGLGLMSHEWIVGLAVLVLVLVLSKTRLSPFACLAGLVAALAWGLSVDGLPAGPTLGLNLPVPVLPSTAAFREAAETVLIPQFMLTVANAVLATAALAATYFSNDAKSNITPRRLALSTGGLNLVLAPFGALPMCHGAGGLVAQYKFGARTGLAPTIFGASCLTLGLLWGDGALAILTLLPLAGVGALLAVAGGEMAANKRLFDARPHCLAIILLTAAVCVFVNVAVGVLIGLAAEFIRSRVWRRLNGPAGK